MAEAWGAIEIEEGSDAAGMAAVTVLVTVFDDVEEASLVAAGEAGEVAA
jgi:hypothetical protein